jgi:hypothetical protein
MKSILKLFVLCSILFGSILSEAQVKRIYFTEVYGEFLGNLTANSGGNKTPISAIGIGGHVCVGNQYLSSILEVNYRMINLKDLNISGVEKVNSTEFYLGARYFPMRPTVMAGNVALRFTVGAMYGFDLETNWRPLLFTGIAVTPIRHVSGITVNVVYRPETLPTSGYLLEPSWTIRTAILIGPKTKN